MRQGGFPVLKMAPRTNPVSWLSFTVTETTVVEKKCGQARLGKPFGKWLKSECSFRTEAVCHYDDRRTYHSFWEVKPPSAPQPARRKTKIVANPISVSHVQNRL